MSDLVDSYIELVKSFRADAELNFAEEREWLKEKRQEFEAELKKDKWSKSQRKIIQGNIDRIDQREFELQGELMIAVSTDVLEPFDIKRFDDDQVTAYFDHVNQYNNTENGHYVLQIFTLCYANEMNAPKWVLAILFTAFAEYLIAPEQDTTQLLKDLSLVGAASGATNLWAQKKSHDDEHTIMLEMAKIINDVGLSKNNAARCVILKHDLDASVSTIKRKFNNEFGWLRASVERRTEGPMNEVERTKFVTSFPPEAQTIIRKGSSR